MADPAQLPSSVSRDVEVRRCLDQLRRFESIYGQDATMDIVSCWGSLCLAWWHAARRVYQHSQDDRALDWVAWIRRELGARLQDTLALVYNQKWHGMRNSDKTRVRTVARKFCIIPSRSAAPTTAAAATASAAEAGATPWPMFLYFEDATTSMRKMKELSAWLRENPAVTLDQVLDTLGQILVERSLREDAPPRVGMADVTAMMHRLAPRQSSPPPPPPSPVAAPSSPSSPAAEAAPPPPPPPPETATPGCKRPSSQSAQGSPSKRPRLDNNASSSPSSSTFVSAPASPSQLPATPELPRAAQPSHSHSPSVNLSQLAQNLLNSMESPLHRPQLPDAAAAAADQDAFAVNSDLDFELAPDRRRVARRRTLEGVRMVLRNAPYVARLDQWILRSASRVLVEAARHLLDLMKESEDEGVDEDYGE